MALVATDHTIANRIGQRIVAALKTAWRMAVDFRDLTARVNAAEPLLHASEEQLRARGLTRAEVMDYILNGRTRA